MDERVFFHLSEVVLDRPPDERAVDADAKADATTAGGANDGGDAAGAAAAASASASASSAAAAVNTKKISKGIIERGQEVAFRMGKRQGKPIGTRVRKLKAGTLPKEEPLLLRFVGVVVVAPRNIAAASGSTEKEKVTRQWWCFEFLLLGV